MSAFRGFLGEIIVHISLKLGLNNRDYHIFRNLIVPYPGGTSQIDNLVVSRYGIFVIEVKNYRGWIFGDQEQRNWTQVIYKKKYSFQNPLNQNRGHILTLEKFLALDQDKFHSVIYFSPRSCGKTQFPKNVLWEGLIPYIKSKRDEVMTQEEISSILLMIVGLSRFNGLGKSNHLRNLQNRSKLDRKSGRRKTELIRH